MSGCNQALPGISGAVSQRADLPLQSSFVPTACGWQVPLWRCGFPGNQSFLHGWGFLPSHWCSHMPLPTQTPQGLSDQLRLLLTRGCGFLLL